MHFICFALFCFVFVRTKWNTHNTEHKQQVTRFEETSDKPNKTNNACLRLAEPLHCGIGITDRQQTINQEFENKNQMKQNEMTKYKCKMVIKIPNKMKKKLSIAFQFNFKTDHISDVLSIFPSHVMQLAYFSAYYAIWQLCLAFFFFF